VEPGGLLKSDEDYREELYRIRQNQESDDVRETFIEAGLGDPVLVQDRW
jgi:hypothetical protein